jgi:hypothetical protein
MHPARSTRACDVLLAAATPLLLGTCTYVKRERPPRQQPATVPVPQQALTTVVAPAPTVKGRPGM